MADARFEDGVENPVRLLVQDLPDLPVVSALIQDALVQPENISWMKGKRRVAILLARFRWEDQDDAKTAGRPFERVQSLLLVDGVLGFRAQGIKPGASDVVLSVLSMHFEAGEDGAGVVRFTLAGDGELAMDVECLDIRLQDVSRPYVAKAKSAPDHKIED